MTRVAAKPTSAHEYGERRTALIEATIRLIAREGMRSFRYRAVASEAKVAHPLIAHHFGNLDTLLDAAMDRSLDITTRELVITSDAGELDSFAEGFLQGVDRLNEVLTFQYHVMIETRGPDAERRLAQIHDSYRQAITQALTLAGCSTTPGLIELAYAALEGIVFHQLMNSGSGLNELALAQLRTMLRAVQPIP